MSQKPSSQNYEDLTEYMKYVVDCFAAFWKPSEIALAVEEQQFKDDNGNPHTPSANVLRNYSIRYADIIKKRREELSLSTIPLLDPTIRMRYLQEIADEAREGDPRLSKSGYVVFVKDHKTVISVVQEFNRMTGTYKEAGAEPKDEKSEKRRLVEELRAELRRSNPLTTDDEINAVVLNTLGSEVKEYLN